MKVIAKLSLTLALALSIGGRAHSQDIGRGQFQADVSHYPSASSSIPVVPEPSASGNHRGVTRYATGSDGDYSLDAAIVAEQVFARYSLYTVRLQFASGAEQSIAVTAPPGGLRPKMLDMSGDSVPNDLVLTSRLLRSPLIVLLNDGHDHFTVASSPGSFASGEGRASGPHKVHRASVCVSSGFKPRGLTNGRGLFLSQPEQNFLSPIYQIVTKHAGYTSSSGRAPPALVTQILRASY